MEDKNPFAASNELIKKFMEENDLEAMHLIMYLDTQHIVCVSEEDYKNLEPIRI